MLCIQYSKSNASYIYPKNGNPIYLKEVIVKLKNYFNSCLSHNIFTHRACSLAKSLIFTSNVNWTCSPEWAHEILYCMKTYCFLWCLSSWHSPTHGCRHVADGCMTHLWWTNIFIAWKYRFIIKVLFANNLLKWIFRGVLNIIL